MYNLLIIEKNSYKLRKLINNFSNNLQNLKVLYVSYNVESIYSILNKFMIDIILLDLEDDENYAIQLIKYIQKYNFYHYKKSIVIMGSKKSNDFIESDYIFSYVDNFQELIKTFKKLINEKENKKEMLLIKNKIKNELLNLNYNYSYIGTKYLEETIFEIYKVRFDFDGKIEKNIYSILANKYNKKTNTIYCNIKQATKNMILNCNKDKIKDYFGYLKFTKPKVQNIIYTILNKID